MTGGLAITRTDRAGLDRMVEWATAEGWNPGLHDADCFYAADPEGFWMATYNGAPAACVSLVHYGDDFAFLGFYIARPEVRGRGIGLALWQAALEASTAGTAGLDGVVAQQDTYRKSGFVLAHRNIRYAGTVDAAAPDRSGLVAIDTTRAEAVAAYDRGCFGFARPAFLRCWLSAPGHVALAAIAGDAVTGYGVVRPCHAGHKIGPLFADDAATAERLFRALAAEAGGGTVILDPPAPNATAVALCEAHGMKPAFETARMYRGPAPGLPVGRIFGITTFELG
jgi:GNAT superfamily N-acetyltransferase